MQTSIAVSELNSQNLSETINLLNDALNQAGDHAHQLFIASHTPVGNDEDALNRAELMDILMDMAKSEEDICMLYAHAISDWIEEYEMQDMDMPQLPAAEMLKGMMEIRGIRQKDLSHIATQSTISEILNGKRQATARQAKALAEYFSLPLDSFID